MQWEKLVEVKRKAISNGAVFRAEAQWPYEEIVDFMLVDFPIEYLNFTIVVASGIKAGLVLVRLPEDAKYEHGRAISKEWLVTNWAKWIYPECLVENVLFIPNYEIAKP